MDEMENSFNFIKPSEPTAGLFDEILARIRREQRLRAAKRRMTIFSIGALGSIAAFVPVLRMTQSAFSASGFTGFFSLFFSDFEIITAYWQNFFFALLESFPAMSVVAFLGVILVFIQSLRFLTKDVKFFLTPATKGRI